MSMKLAVNYSTPAAHLVRSGVMQTDLFKCPAWPDLLPTVQAVLPAYIHFPLKVGAGKGEALDFETQQPADWRKVETLLAQTSTPFINLHLSPTVQEHPGVALNELHPDQIEKVTACLLCDVEAIVRRFGADRVIVENDYDETTGLPQAACLPEVIAQVVQTTGCGFLLDLSHARLSAQRLTLPIQTYMASFSNIIDIFRRTDAGYYLIGTMTDYDLAKTFLLMVIGGLISGLLLPLGSAYYTLLYYDLSSKES